MLAGRVANSLDNYNAPSTHAYYDSATKQYVDFCKSRGIPPFPVDALWLAAWMNLLALM